MIDQRDAGRRRLSCAEAERLALRSKEQATISTRAAHRLLASLEPALLSLLVGGLPLGLGLLARAFTRRVTLSQLLPPPLAFGRLFFLAL
eukprot:6166620-Pleurochrysis_carterae.AAC.1